VKGASTFARRLASLVSAVVWAVGSAATAACLDVDRMAADPPPSIPELGPGVFGPTTRDGNGRIVAPVAVNGQGPFRFLVDTGATRSVVTSQVVRRLNLVQVGEGEVHSVHDMVIAPLVKVDALSYAGLALASGKMPVLDGAVLGGSDGVLGVDALRGRLLRIDFDQGCLEIAPAQSPRRLAQWTQVRAELRFGNLVVMQGRVLNQNVNVVIDTGSDSSVANLALRDQLRLRVDRQVQKQVRSYTAGQPIVLDSAVLIPLMTLGEVRAQNIVVFVGDFHIFRLWDLQREPTMLVGMDVLSQTRALAIDYERGTVYFRLRRPARGL
jgi:predicted aspartyl protease